MFQLTTVRPNLSSDVSDVFGGALERIQRYRLG